MKRNFKACFKPEQDDMNLTVPKKTRRNIIRPLAILKRSKVKHNDTDKTLKQKIQFGIVRPLAILKRSNHEHKEADDVSPRKIARIITRSHVLSSPIKDKPEEIELNELNDTQHPTIASRVLSRRPTNAQRSLCATCSISKRIKLEPQEVKEQAQQSTKRSLTCSQVRSKRIKIEQDENTNITQRKPRPVGACKKLRSERFYIDYQYRMMIKNLTSIIRETCECVYNSLRQLKRELRQHFGIRVALADECCRGLVIYDHLMDLCDDLLEGFKPVEEPVLHVKAIEEHCRQMAPRVKDIFLEYNKIFYRYSSGPEPPWPQENKRARLLFKRLSEKPHFLQMNMIVVVEKFLAQFPKVKISGTEAMIHGLIYIAETACAYQTVDGDLYQRHVTDNSRDRTMISNRSLSSIMTISSDSTRSSLEDLTDSEKESVLILNPMDRRIKAAQRRLPSGHVVF
ncbi:hypothetical protein ACOME3_005595 [Neoechinorhynchus agilis]